MSKAPVAETAAATGSPKSDIDRTARNEHLARAMDLFEYRIHDLVCATKLLEVVKGSTLDQSNNPVVEMVRARCAFVEEFHVYVFEKGEVDALLYAIHHVGDLASAIGKDFLAALEGPSP